LINGGCRGFEKLKVIHELFSKIAGGRKEFKKLEDMPLINGDKVIILAMLI